MMVLIGLLALTACQRAKPGMAWVPGGPFLMGSNDVDTAGRAQDYGLTKPWFDDEHPAHQVTLPGFFIDQNEVTNAQFAQFIAATGARSPGTWKTAAYPSEHADEPVASVNWYQARDYCAWAGKRLPTEAEWEKAARGPDGRLYPWGNEFDPKKANLLSAALAPVGRFPQGQSPYGVNDLAGNVWEWTDDWYLPYPGSTTKWKDFGQQYKVLRGKSWTKGFGHQEDRPTADIVAHEARSSFRLYFDPLYGFNDLGFRCAAS